MLDSLNNFPLQRVPTSLDEWIYSILMSNVQSLPKVLKHKLRLLLINFPTLPGILFSYTNKPLGL